MKLSGEESFVVERVRVEKDGVKMTGGALFNGKENRMVGELDETDVIGYNFITGEHKNGIISALIGRDEIAAMEIFTVKSEIKALVKGEDITFHVFIEAEGHLGEDQNAEAKPFEEQYLRSLEQAFAKEIETITDDTIRKLQNRFGLDPFGFLDQLRIKHYSAYKKVRKDWEQGRKIFSQVPIKTKVEVAIRRIGTTGNPRNSKS